MPNRPPPEKEWSIKFTAREKFAFPRFWPIAVLSSLGKLRISATASVNAVSVKLDPPVEALKPTYRHCIDIAPRKTTTYTLTAVNAAGKSKSVSLEVRVER